MSRPRRSHGVGKPDLVLSIPSDNAFLSLVRDLTKKLAQGAGFDDTTAGRVALAVDEATTNVIEHAYHGAKDREVLIRFSDRGADFRIDVVDTGDTVDPRSVPRFNLEQYVSERRTGGLGMHLMGKIMDSVTFRRSGGRNVCGLVKHKRERDSEEH